MPRDDKDHEHNIILELRPTAGGEEAALFARELFEMYRQHAAAMGWRAETLTSTASDSGGVKEASLSITADGYGGSDSGSLPPRGPYGRLKFESGVHRVQRVPVTETSGRLHTRWVALCCVVLRCVALYCIGWEQRSELPHTSARGGAHRWLRMESGGGR